MSETIKPGYATPEEIEEWLQAPSYPGHWDSSYSSRKNRHETYHRTPMHLLEDALEAARAKDGKANNHIEIYNRDRGIEYIVTYEISNVKLIKPCPDGHDYTEWRYDFTGGDIRECRTCGLKEHA